MNAGKRELIWMRNALPDTDSASKEINWLSYIENGEKSDSKLQKDWLSGVPGSLAPCHLVIASIQCMRNRGYVVDKAEFLINEGLKALEDNDMGMLQKVTSKIYIES